MRVIVFGDTHGRDVWKQVVNTEKWDMVIFLGDYFTSRDGISEADQIANFKEIMEFKDLYPDHVILCIGNHDTQAMRYSWADCSPRFYSNWAYDNRAEILSRCQWVYVIDDIVFSHAGITTQWFDNVKKAHPEVKTFDDINLIEPCELFGFTPCKLSDYYGDSQTQPCTWVRPACLTEYGVPGYTYVVGHTRPQFISNYRELCLRHIGSEPWALIDVWTCDNLPKEYLVIDTDKKEFIPVKIQ